ncbi:MAG: L-2-amino-thiazoline-4-carboxylic acid hydrolase [Actinomycetota bacterium]|jgi:predicted ArsR family transcriptional regulator|nr:L-2-amino-thiazoline-4-carboxylic acid hydrolase [Actinomycetota bacterium]
MNDEFQKHFQWFSDLLKNPIPDLFEVGSIEHTIITKIKNEWGKCAIVKLLTGLKEEYGKKAFKAVDKYLELNISRDWAEIGKREAHEGTEIEDFIRLLWSPLRGQGFEFTIKCENGASVFCVKKCPVYELAEKTGMHKWLYHLACATDFYATRAFSEKIGFKRTKTLMQGYECCDHLYYSKIDK